MISRIIKLLISIAAVSVAIFVVLGANSYTSLLPEEYQKPWELLMPEKSTEEPVAEPVAEPVVEPTIEIEEEPQIIEADTLQLQGLDTLASQHLE